MAVALGTGTPSRSLSPASGTGGTSASWTISGSNPVIVVFIGVDSNVSVSSVSWSLGSGTTLQIATIQRDPGSVQSATFVWAIPAPTTGAGTYTVSLSGTTNYQISASYFTGADQTTPCPTSDADTDKDTGSDGPALTLTPTNVSASDAMAAATSHTQTGDSAGWTTGTTLVENNTTPCNMLTGYRLATGSMTSAALSGGSGSRLTAVATRIAAVATTNIATISGLSKSSVQTVEGLAIGSMQSWMGLT